MKAASISEVKQELAALPPKEVLALCLRLAKYKKENKELLSYLLFEAHDEQNFVENIKQEIEEGFEELNTTNWYFAKKGLRKILKGINKYSKYSGIKETQIESLIYFCKKTKASGLKLKSNQVLTNLYNQQVKKIDGLIAQVDEDLQFDYRKQMNELYL